MFGWANPHLYEIGVKAKISQRALGPGGMEKCKYCKSKLCGNI